MSGAVSKPRGSRFGEKHHLACQPAARCGARRQGGSMLMLQAFLGEQRRADYASLIEEAGGNNGGLRGYARRELV